MKAFENKVWLSSPTMHGEEQMFIKEAFDTNWIAPLGKNVDEFEKSMAQYVGVNASTALVSGTSALHLAVKLAGIGRGDIVFDHGKVHRDVLDPADAVPLALLFVVADQRAYGG